jgi:hypothetical protein
MSSQTNHPVNTPRLHNLEYVLTTWAFKRESVRLRWLFILSWIYLVDQLVDQLID